MTMAVVNTKKPEIKKSQKNHWALILMVGRKSASGRLWSKQHHSTNILNVESF